MLTPVSTEKAAQVEKGEKQQQQQKKQQQQLAQQLVPT
jgi:hypothetical protein